MLFRTETRVRKTRLFYRPTKSNNYIEPDSELWPHCYINLGPADPNWFVTKQSKHQVFTNAYFVKDSYYSNSSLKQKVPLGPSQLKSKLKTPKIIKHERKQKLSKGDSFKGKDKEQIWKKD